MSTEKKVMAIITNFEIGMVDFRDAFQPGARFSVSTSEGSGCVMSLRWGELKDVIEAYGTADLDGKPCWMVSGEKDGAFGPGCIMKWGGPCVIK